MNIFPPHRSWYDDLELLRVLFSIHLSEEMTLTLVGQAGHLSAWAGGVGKHEGRVRRLEILRIKCKDKGASNNPT